MIQAQMKPYEYCLYSNTIDAYGEPTLSNVASGSVKMAINILSQSVEESILYTGAEYIGLTQQEVNDNYVIQYNGEKLKVLYINPLGRYKQVFMKRM